MNWGIEDFVAAAVLLALAGMGVVLVRRRVKSKKQRVAFIALIVFVFLAVWAELAVGIFH